MKYLVLSFILSITATTFVIAQNDTLPKFTLKKKEGKVSVSWINRYPNAHQVTIQRSKDSLKNFITIFSLPDPSLHKYNYTDEKAPNDSMFYRIFILIEGTNYFFSGSKKPVKDTTKEVTVLKTINIKGFEIKNQEEKKKQEDDKSVVDKKTDAQPKEEKPVVKKYVWAPSVYVFTADDGNISIVCPDYKTKKYTIRFFEENDTSLFELHEVKESPLLMDKVNFLHSGWFKFELYENGQLIEKNKFLITRDN